PYRFHPPGDDKHATGGKDFQKTFPGFQWPGFDPAGPAVRRSAMAKGSVTHQINRLIDLKSRRKMDREPVTGHSLCWGVADVLRTQRRHGPPRTHPPGIGRGEERTRRLALRPVPATGASATPTRAPRP